MRQTSITSQEIPCRPFDDFHLLFTHRKSLPLRNCTEGIRTFKATNLLTTMAALYMLQDQPCHLVRNSKLLLIIGLNLPANSKEIDKTAADFNGAGAFITRHSPPGHVKPSGTNSCCATVPKTQKPPSSTLTPILAGSVGVNLTVSTLRLHTGS